MESRRKITKVGVAECLCHLCIIPLSIATMIQAIYSMLQVVQVDMEESVREELASAAQETSGELLMAALFIMMAVSRVLMAYRRKGEGRLVFVTTMIQAGVFLACAALPFILGFSMETLTIASLIYGGAMILGRIVSMIRDHRVRNILMNIAAIAVIAYCALSLTLATILIACLSLAFILMFIFSGINLKMLRDIIRKTYAAEIIFGLVMLILTFSFLLTALEPAMGNYLDALWYCFALVTTIGFGDITAVTVPGRILSVILGVYGIVVVALITSIIVNFYGEMKKEKTGKKEAQ